MRIKLIYPPLYYPSIEKKPDKMFYRRSPARIPLISLPILKSYLNEKGFFVEQDDLDIKVYTKNKFSEEGNKIWMGLFDDMPRIRKFLETGSDPQLEDEAEKALKNTNYTSFDAIGFSVTNEWNIAGFGATLVLAKLIKEKTGSLIILGGSDIGQILNLFEKKSLLKFIDIMLLESNFHAHYDFLQILKSLEDASKKGKLGKRNHFFTDSYGRNKPVVFHTKKLRINVLRPNQQELTKEEAFPVPDFEGLPLELYKYGLSDIDANKVSKSKILVLPYYFSSGCPNSCIFCGCSASKDFTFKNPERISEELERISSKHNTRFFIFYNTSLNPTRCFVNELIKELKRKDLNLLWSDCATIKNMDKKILKGLYECGARRIIYGVESPSPRLLRYVEKGISVARIEKILKLSHETGIWNEVELICGLPHESNEDIQKTLGFIDQNNRYINHYNLHQFKLVRSKLSLNPSKYGINNINEREDKSIPGKAFDEISGLKWKNKLKQIQTSFEIVKSHLLKFPNYGYTDSDECFLKLIYLYSTLESKKEVLDYLKKNPFNSYKEFTTTPGGALLKIKDKYKALIKRLYR